jgi:hypothetical protein
MVLALTASAAFAQYPLVPIDSIQWVPVGQDSSRYAGDTVQTGGLVVAGTGLYYAGSGVTFYMENPNGGPFSGIMAYNPTSQGFPELIPGDSIMCTALVSEYAWDDPFCVMTELFIVPGTFEYRMYGMPQPEAEVILATVVDSTGGADSLAEQWEGVFCKVFGLTVDTVVNYTTTSVWHCHDSTGTVLIREASDSIPNSFRPDVGQTFDFVQGVFYHRFGAYHLQPRYMRDIQLQAGAPFVTAYHEPNSPIVGDVVTFYDNVVDDSGIEDVRLYYRINLAGWINVPMVDQGNNLYTFDLPSPIAGWDVDYYVEATDDSSLTTKYPPEAPFTFLEYIVQEPQEMTIAEARVDNNGDFIPDLLDSAVILTGVATSFNFADDRTDFFMQQEGAGINVFYQDELISVNIGDSITVNGIIDQYNGKTQVVIAQLDRLTPNGPGTVPEPLTIYCADLAEIDGEQYEGTLVKVFNVEILEDPDPWPALGWSATMTITDGADSASLRIDRYTDIDGQPQVEPRADIVGIGSQYDTSDPYLSYYQLMPRMYDDFTWITTGIDDNDILPQNYSLAQNYPNPFNPSTNLEFSMKNTGHVLITIYNLLGQKVCVVTDAEFPAGKHTVEWDGTDYDGQKVTSGIYLYRMEAGDFSDAKKMIVLK